MAIERVNSSTAEQLRATIQRIERIQEERDDLSLDIAELYREAKGNGYNVKALKALIAERRKRERNPTAYDADSADLDLYRSVLLGFNVEEETPAPVAPEPPGSPVRAEIDVPEGAVDTCF